MEIIWSKALELIIIISFLLILHPDELQVANIILMASPLDSGEINRFTEEEVFFSIKDVAKGAHKKL